MTADRGIVYVAFGDKAAREAAQSIATLAKIGADYPVAVVGDRAVAGAEFIRWSGSDPFDASDRHNFQFRAVYPKSALAGLSPFERTLYLDVDTTFLRDPAPAFDMLDDWQLLVTTHVLDHVVGNLFNAKNAGWYHNRRERRVTVAEFGDGDVPYINSGVIFWKRCAAVQRVFDAWLEEWKRFAQWDEQLALMRAIRKHPCRVLTLPVAWNAPHRSDAVYVHHAYGRGHARSDHDTPPIPGRETYRGVVTYTTLPERDLLAEVAGDVPAGGQIVEIGALYGGTTAVLATAAPDATVTSIDIFEWHPDGPASAQRLLDNVHAVGIDNVRVLEEDSSGVAAKWSGRPDFVLIDGGHSYDACLADLRAWGPIARVIACHDYRSPAWTSVTDAVNDYCAQTDWYVAQTAGTVCVLRRKGK